MGLVHARADDKNIAVCFDARKKPVNISHVVLAVPVHANQTLVGPLQNMCKPFAQGLTFSFFFRVDNNLGAAFSSDLTGSIIGAMIDDQNIQPFRL